MKLLPLLDRYFLLSKRKTTVGTELVAGLTSFAAMAYCIAANPSIMAHSGMDQSSVMIATCIVGMVSSIMMGLLANLPIGVAPGMGSNIIFTFVLVIQLGCPWPAALAVVAITGLIFLLLTLTGLRERIANGVPETLRVGIQVAVGLVIMFIGMRTAGFIVANHNTFVGMGSLHSPSTLLTIAGFIFTPVLVARRVPAALILSIIVLTAAGLFLDNGHGHPITTWPSQIVALPHWPHQTFMAIDPLYVVHHIVYLAPMLFFFLCTEMFGTLANLLGVVGAAGLIEKDGKIPNATGAFATDAIGSIIGPIFGTAIVAAYTESVTGVQAGGRTGLTAIVIGVCFGLSLFFWPLFLIVPPQATAPALLMVGILMFQGISRIDLRDLTQVVPVLLTVMVALLSSNLVYGMALGTFSYIVMTTATGRIRDISAVVWGLAVIFTGFLIVSAKMQ